jgi:hypothetical protein
MRKKYSSAFILILIIILFATIQATAQIGTRFPSEKKVVKDPVSGIDLTFFTSRPVGHFQVGQDSGRSVGGHKETADSGNLA